MKNSHNIAEDMMNVKSENNLTFNKMFFASGNAKRMSLKVLL